MTSPGSPTWELWAPPLAPPVDTGLPYEFAAEIAAVWWDDDPHLCAALQWEAYAATLPPGLPVSSVTTGYQSVTYGESVPGGELGLAMSRAAWHRSFNTGHSVPLRATPELGQPCRYTVWPVWEVTR